MEKNDNVQVREQAKDAYDITYPNLLPLIHFQFDIKSPGKYLHKNSEI